MLSTDSDILKAAEDWRKEGRAVALATVVETWGSAPRPVGANLVIDQDGNFLGSVSGGCVEGAVVTEALDVIELASQRCWNSASPMRPPGRSASPAAARSACWWRRWISLPSSRWPRSRPSRRMNRPTEIGLSDFGMLVAQAGNSRLGGAVTLRASLRSDLRVTEQALHKVYS